MNVGNNVVGSDDKEESQTLNNDDGVFGKPN